MIVIPIWVIVIFAILFVFLLVFFLVTFSDNRFWKKRESVLREDVVNIFNHTNGGGPEKTMGEKLSGLEKAVSKFLGEEGLYNGANQPPEKNGGQR